MLCIFFYCFLPDFGTFRLYSPNLNGVRLKEIELSDFRDQMSGIYSQNFRQVSTTCVPCSQIIMGQFQCLEM